VDGGVQTQRDLLALAAHVYSEPVLTTKAPPSTKRSS
jgi:hypothetical protein